MSEISNIQNYDFYLNFLSDDYGLKQIDEPVGIDAINLLTESDDNRYARDSYFGGDGNVRLIFTSEQGSKNLGYEFDKLVEYSQRFGFDGKVEFIMRNRITELDFVVGQIEFEQKETDEYSYFSCNIDQVQQQAIIKRFQETKVNLFAEEDLKGNVIDPVQTYNMLLPTKPVVQISSWNSTPFAAYTGLSANGLSKILFQNPISSSVLFGIKNTLNGSINRFATTTTAGGVPTTQLADFVFIDAVDDLSDIKITIKDLKISYYVEEGASFTDDAVSTPGVINPRYRTWIGTDSDISSEGLTIDFLDYDLSYEGVFNVDSLNIDGQTGNRDKYDLVFEEEVIEIDSIPSGKSLYASFFMDRFRTVTEWVSGTVEIRASKIGVDTVTSVVRYIDATNQVATSIDSSFNIIAPRLESQGEFYNQMLATGDMIRGRDSAFHLEWKELMEHAMNEFNMDYQTVGNNIFLGNEDDYFPNVEIGVFLQKPDSTYNITFNPRFTINKVEYKFKSYNQDKDDENTIDAVHTENELLVPNEFVQDIKGIDIDFIRDPFLIATTQDKAATETSTSLSEDDKVFIFDAIPVAPSQTRTLQRSLVHNVNSDGNLQLLGEGFNWSILGFILDDTVTLNNTSNSGSYTVVEITNTIVTLEPQGFTPTSIGRIITSVTYPLTNVQYIFRTNEGFDNIEGVESPNEYGNLRFSIKRNLLATRGAYLKTATRYNPEDINIQYSKNEVPLVTTFEEVTVDELAPITQDELPEAILSPNYIKAKVLCSFEDYQDLKERLETINDTENHIKTIGGFVRICDNNGRVRKGYITKADYQLAEGVLDLELEEKFESEITDITYSGALYFIDEAGYDLDGTSILDYVQTDTDYLQLFDPNTVPLTNKKRFDLYSVNGTVYNSMNELITAIEAL